jgi:threonine/homoserine/homoserine lactone efflux protein
LVQGRFGLKSPSHLRSGRLHAHCMTFLLLGLALGAATIIPPGPVSMSLIQVGARGGKQSGAGAGFGVAAGDAVVALAALVIVALGAASSPSIGTALTIAGIGTLVVTGGALLCRPQAVEALALAVRNPGRALFAVTTLTPSTLLGWIAIMAAVPTTSVQARLLVAIGIIVVSTVWHPLLGMAASGAGSRMSAQGLTIATRCGGAGLIAIAAVLTLI